MRRECRSVTPPSGEMDNRVIFSKPGAPLSTKDRMKRKRGGPSDAMAHVTASDSERVLVGALLCGGIFHFYMRRSLRAWGGSLVGISCAVSMIW